MSKPRVHIENWVIAGAQILGDVVDHPRFPKGTPVTTSRIVDMPQHPKQGDTVETMNTSYILGKQLRPTLHAENKTKPDTYDYWENLEHDYGFSEKEMTGIKRAVEAHIKREVIEARADEVKAIAVGFPTLKDPVKAILRRITELEAQLKTLTSEVSDNG